MPVVIPELVYIVGLFFAIVGYLAARGLLATWTHSLGYALAWLGSHLRVPIRLPFKTVHIDLGGPFRAADHAIVTALQNWCTGAEIEMGYCLHGLEKVGRYLAQAVDILARETSQTFDWLLHVRLRQLLKLLAAPLLLPLLIPKLLAAVLPHVKHGAVTTVRVVTHEVTHATTTVVRKTVGGAVAFPPWVIRLPRRVGRVERDAVKLGHRVRRVEGLFAAGVMAAVLANVLGVATRCIRRGNIGKMARRVCGMDSSLLDSLLLGGLAITGTVSVVEFTKDLRAIEDEAVNVLGAMIREWPS